MWWIVGVFIFLAVVFVLLYNGLVKLKNQLENSFAQIDTQLQRRFDLIPNLVETVKGFAAHESAVFENVTAARAATANARTVAEKAEADNRLTSTLKTLFAVSENYPDLRANSNFKELHAELVNTENKIAFSRQFYNDSVNKFNTAIALFPKNIVAAMIKYEKAEYFQVMDATTRGAVKVQF